MLLTKGKVRNFKIRQGTTIENTPERIFESIHRSVGESQRLDTAANIPVDSKNPLFYAHELNSTYKPLSMQYIFLHIKFFRFRQTRP